MCRHLCVLTRFYLCVAVIVGIVSIFISDAINLQDVRSNLVDHEQLQESRKSHEEH